MNLRTRRQDKFSLLWENMISSAVISRFIYDLRFLGITVLLLLVTACAAQKKQPYPNNTSLNAEIAINTFSAGLRNISERYIKAYSAPNLALKGLKGLSVIDPSIQVEGDKDFITVNSETTPTHQYPNPNNSDYKGWASLIVQIIFDLKRESQLFKRTNMNLVYQAIFDGSISMLDTFSRYSGPEKTRQNKEQRSGFGGIGIRFKYVDNGIAITRIFPGMPAAKIGLQLDDIITHVDGDSLAKLKKNDVREHLRGKIGSIIDIKILRPNNHHSAITKLLSFKFFTYTRSHYHSNSLSFRAKWDRLSPLARI